MCGAGPRPWHRFTLSLSYVCAGYAEITGYARYNFRDQPKTADDIGDFVPVIARVKENYYVHARIAQLLFFGKLKAFPTIQS